MDRVKMIVATVRNDLKNGENLDAYVLIILGLFFALLDIIGVVDFNIIGPVILMAISILVIVDVVSRHKIKQLHQILTTDNELRSNSTRALMSERSLLDGVAHCLEDKVVLERVNIFAHTSNVYYQAIAKSKVRIRYLRLLLRKMDSVDDMQLPEVQADREMIRSRQTAQVEEWQRLAKQGRIERIDVAFYPFEPMVHMLIVDGKRAVFGINLVLAFSVVDGETSEMRHN